jgi:hypothetical protein
MSVLDHLWTMPGVYWGLGRGPNTDFVCRVSVTPHDDGSVTLDYEAWSQDEGLQHAEAMRLCRVPDDSDRVLLMATSDGSEDTMTFREGDQGVFGSTGRDRVGLVLVPDDGRLGFSWWWPDENGVLSQQSRAELRLLRPLVQAPPSLHADVQEPPAVAPSSAADAPDDEQHDDDHQADDQHDGDQHDDHQQADREPDGNSGLEPDAQAAPAQHSAPEGSASESPPEAPAEDAPASSAPPTLPDVPWPGIVVLAGNGTGVVAQRLAERLTRAADVRTELFDKAVRGSDAATVDPALRHRIAIAVTHGYARSGHPVILHGAASRVEHAQLVDELRTAGLTPVRLVDVADGEDYGEVARRLIDGD